MQFVGLMFLMAFATVSLAIVQGSLAWLLGGIVFLAVGIYALRLLLREVSEPEPEEVDEDALMRFMLKALAVAMALGGGMVWFFVRDA